MASSRPPGVCAVERCEARRGSQQSAALRLAPGGAPRDQVVARRLRRTPSMKRSLVFAVAILVGLFVGTALQVQAATTSAPSAAGAQGDASGPGYWASWADAASH